MPPADGHVRVANRPNHTKARQRVSVACVPCRVRRIRCDGVEPYCGPCQQRHTACEYQHTENKRKPPSKKLVQSLQARIHLLEQQLSELGSPVPPASNDATEDFVESEGATGDNGSTSTGSQKMDPLTEISGMAAPLNFTSDGQLRYFGALSNYNLLHGRIHEVSAEISQNQSACDFSPLAQVNNGQGISQELQDHLLDLYWRWQNPWNYVMHKDAFTQDYVHDRSGKYCTPLLLLAIFSVAARYSDRVEVRTTHDNPKTAGEPFARQAKELLQRAIETPTIPTVQAAVLLGLNAMAEDRESLGWLYVGMAVRMAFNLGLNLSCSYWVGTGHISELEAEVRKVTWWGCYTLDKLFSLSHGRPAMTRKYDISCPKPSQSGPTEFGAWIPLSDRDQSLAGAHIRIASTSRYTSELLVIATEALDVIYAPNSGLKHRELEGIITRADITLNEFYRDLPSFLRLPASTRPACLPHIYQLHIQYNVIQILLHRPFIAKRRVASRLFSDSSEESNVHLQTCRRSALEVTKILRAYQDHYTLRLIPIITVHNTFTAAIIHLMDATSNASAIRRRGIHNLRICVDALEIMSTAWCWSCRAIRALRILAQEWLSPDAVKDGGLEKAPPSPIECSPETLYPETPVHTLQAPPMELANEMLPSGFANMATALQGTGADTEMDPPLLDDNLDWLLHSDHHIGSEPYEQEDFGAQLDPWVMGAAQSTFSVPSWDDFAGFGDVWYPQGLQQHCQNDQ